jgi:ABC-type polysaccharide/polyol phosphate export permease
MSPRVAAAISDVMEGIRRWELWGTIAWYDIRHRYRRSALGPMWLTLSMAVMVGTLALLYSRLFGQELKGYLPYVTLGLIFWGLISSFILEAGYVFSSAEPIIRQIQIPLSIHVYRMIYRNLIILGHNFVIFIAVALLLGLWPGWAALLAIPGLALLCVNALWGGFLVGMAGARFRDIPPIVASVLPVLFLITPIIWQPQQLPGLFVTLNPLHYTMAVVRDPLLGQVPPLSTWLLVLGFAIVGCAATLAVFARFRGRIAYWV